MKRNSSYSLVLLFLAVAFVMFLGISCAEGGNKPPYKVGDIGPAGGYIFYDDEVGFDLDESGTIEANEKNLLGGTLRYLEAAPSDLGSAIFGYYRTSDSNSEKVVGTAEEIGSGQENTTKLVRLMENNTYIDMYPSDSTEVYAAKLCDMYSIGLYEDWFLPSKNELYLMYALLFDKTPSLGGFSELSYWSSSDISNHSTSAWAQTFESGNQNFCFKKIDNLVRPIRAF